MRRAHLPVHLPAEPSPERLANPLLRYVLATRPAFLSITVAGIVLGLAVAPAIDLARAVATLLLACLAHAGINVLNDYYDHLNGSDGRNSGRIFPFTGGSRFIQNAVLTPRQTRVWGLTLMGLTAAGGLVLAAAVGPALLWIGLAGLLIGWAYSAPPLRLNSRGLGELCVLAGFVLIVLGTVIVQSGGLQPHALAAALPYALPYALLVTNVLYINQFPDRVADRASGKWHWVARLPVHQAACGYLGIGLLAALSIVLATWRGLLPPAGLIALAAFAPVWPAFAALRRYAGKDGAGGREPNPGNTDTAPEENTAQLRPAIRQTLLAAHLLPVLLAVSLWLGFAGAAPLPPGLR